MTTSGNNLVQVPGSPPQAEPQFAEEQPAHVAADAGRPGVRFSLWWIVAGAVSWAIAVPLAASAAQLVTAPLTEGVIKDLVFGADVGRLVMLGGFASGIVGAIIGLVTAALQWPALGSRGVRGYTWALATLIGWTIALAVTGAVLLSFVPDLLDAVSGLGSSFWHPNTLFPVLLYSGLAGAGIGAVVGLMQWLVLREQRSRSAAWLLASPLAWAFAAMVLVFVGGAFDWLPILFGNGALWIEVLAGAITGTAGSIAAIPALRRVLL